MWSAMRPTWAASRARVPALVHKRGRGTRKTPVFAAVQRGGAIRRHVVADVTGDTLKAAIRQYRRF